MLNDLEDGIVIYALRYALGRQTYAPDDVMIAIRSNWNNINGLNKEVIKKDIKAYLDKPKTDMWYDDWKNFYEEISNA